MHDPHSERMSGSETRAASGLALVFSFRMLGMFMVLPVLATYGMDLKGSTPALIGLAIGAYGLTQAFLQIPFGMISDRIGRLPVIYAGLLIFAAGSLLAAGADTIWGVIAGRVLQGAGAISAAVMALLSDLTREQHRTKAMAMIGMSIGLSFAAAMVIGPVLTRAFGLSGLFLVTAAMALLGILIIAFMVPSAPELTRHRESGVSSQALLPSLKNPDLLRLNFGIFALHAILMASFVAIPLALVELGGLPKEEHWWVYLTALLVGFFGMVPFIIYGEKKRRMKQTVFAAVLVILLCELFFWWFGNSLRALVLGLVVFFTAFNLLEASLPSLISKVAPAAGKGTAMGVYSTSQFLGAALGGIIGGWLYQHIGLAGVFAGCAALCLIWLSLAFTMREPPYVTSMRFPLSMEQSQDAGLVARILAAPGVSEAVAIPAEGAIYIKVDSKQQDRTSLQQLLDQTD
ncbi:MFS transporter [Ectopseudomonas mendocina]|uniref:MFS transporter n=1 Tax=Ectopseudomonas mendocina TaxID=300 RepID=A0ABZ2RIB3_ECTME